MTLVIILIVITAIVALVLIARDSGPRVTQIEHKVERDTEDSDDA